MKQSFLTIFSYLSVFSPFIIQAQGIEMQWVKQIDGPNFDVVNSVESTDDGSVYSTGQFKGTLDFDPGSGTTHLTSIGNSEGFIQKLDANGNLQWVKQIMCLGTSGSSSGMDLVTDANGDVYVVGEYRNGIQIIEDSDTVVLNSIGNGDVFVLKLSANGDLIWLKRIGGFSHDLVRSIDLDLSGNLIIGGNFRNTADFDPSLSVFNLSSTGISYDGYILKLDTNGDFVWVKQIVSTGSSILNNIKIGPNNSIHAAGSFMDSVDLDPGSSVDMYISDLTTHNGYVVKLDSLGNYEWGKHLKCIGEAEVKFYDIAIDLDGSVVTTGHYSGSVDFDPGIGTLVYTDNGSLDGFIHKMDLNGDLLWVKTFGGAFSDRGASVEIGEDGDVFTSGTFSLTVDFDFGLDTVELTSGLGEDIFILKLNGLGEFEWVNQLEGGGAETVGDIHRQENGNLYLVGEFYNTLDFDPSLDLSELTSTVNSNIFIEKFTECILESTDQIESCQSYTWIDGVTYTEDNDSSTYVLVSSQGCDSVVTLNLTINQVSNTSLSLNGTEISTNNSLATYVWLDCKNNFSVIPGETNSTFTGSPGGSYAVQFTENGCVDTSACITLDPLGIMESSLEGEWGLSPNPSKGHFTIKGSQIEAELSIKVFNVVGQEVYFKTVKNTDEVHLDLNVESGLYLVKVTDENGKENHFQLVKE